MRAIAELLLRLALVGLAVGSLVYAAVPVARHSMGIVVLESTSPARPLSIPATERPNLEVLLQKSPFGRTNQSNTAETVPSGNLPKFVLRGVVLSSQTGSTAFLEIDGTVGLFREEESVTPTFALSDVAADHVRLTGQNQTLTLFLNDEDTALESDESEKKTEDQIAQKSLKYVVPTKRVKPGPPETTLEYIDYWRKRIRKNPGAVLRDIGLKPTDDGYVIAEQHNIGVKLAGLQSGDLVRSVNGQAVGNPDDDRRFYDRIAASGQARLEVERNGRILTFSFPLR